MLLHGAPLLRKLVPMIMTIDSYQARPLCRACCLRWASATQCV